MLWLPIGTSGQQSEIPTIAPEPIITAREFANRLRQKSPNIADQFEAAYEKIFSQHGFTLDSSIPSPDMLRSVGWSEEQIQAADSQLDQIVAQDDDTARHLWVTGVCNRFREEKG